MTIEITLNDLPVVDCDGTEDYAPGAPVSGEEDLATPAEMFHQAFGHLVVCEAEDEKPLSPVMAEARRLGVSYRARYNENDAVMKAVGVVMDAGNPDANCHVTRDSLKAALAYAQTAASSDPGYFGEFVAAGQYLSDKWNTFSVSPYKAMDGSINSTSFAAGKERMVSEQFDIARRILTTELNALALDKAQAPPPPVEPPPPTRAKAAMVQQGEVRPGEGPHQVAARVLGSDGKPVEDKDVKALTDAFKRVYEDDVRANRRTHDQMGLKVGHQFVSADDINCVLSHIADVQIKDRLIRIAAQDTVVPAPIIRPIPHRPTVHVEPEFVALLPVRPASLMAS